MSPADTAVSSPTSHDPLVRPVRQSLTERRAEELRLSIARSAMELFVADGDTSATVERIAERAGVAPRTFYRHFAVKEDVVVPLMQRSSRLIATALRAAPPEDDLLAVLAMAFRIPLDDTRLSRSDRAFLGLMMTTPQYRSRWLAVDEDLRDAVCDLLADRLDLGEHGFLHRLAARLLVNTAREVYEEWLTSDSTESVDALLRSGFSLVLSGLAASTHAAS